MKIKVSISIDEDTLNKVKFHVEKGIFRNSSHFIELATDKFLKEVEQWKL